MLNNQIQCPNCRGFKVVRKSETLFHIPWKIKSEYRYDFGLGMLTVGLIFAILGGLVVWGRTRIYGEIGDFDTYMIVIFGVIGIGLLIFSVGILVFGFQFSRRIKKEREHQRVLDELENMYVCQICGYEWRWSPGETLPQIGSNPKLREMGEIHLKEEERKRRNWD